MCQKKIWPKMYGMWTEMCVVRYFTVFFPLSSTLVVWVSPHYCVYVEFPPTNGESFIQLVKAAKAAAACATTTTTVAPINDKKVRQMKGSLKKRKFSMEILF